jgi:coenzyme F420-reducing hydrogenase beta subunit
MSGIVLSNRKKSDFGIREVIRENICIGCGACTVISDAARVTFNKYGDLVADIDNCTESEIAMMDKVCPFTTAGQNETELARLAFKITTDVTESKEIGIFNGLYAGHSRDYRNSGASGGIVNWILSRLLVEGLVDKVIVVGRSEGGDRYFDFKVIENPEDLKSNGTSIYYPVSYDKVLKIIVENPGRYAITGVPCFHKALRQVKAEVPIIAERVVYQIGIVCGQMKSAQYLNYLSRKAGCDVLPTNACFRRKNESGRADSYFFEVGFKTSTGELNTKLINNKDIGANWAMGFFKPRACDFCDDVYAETADVSVMDAWLDRYVHDSKGTSLVVSRSELMHQLLNRGREAGELVLDQVPQLDIIESQRGGLNHRRVGLRYRLYLDKKCGIVPTKRVSPDNRFDIFFKIEQWMRSEIREKSRQAMSRQQDSGLGGLDIFNSEMKFILSLYKWFGRIKKRISSNYDYKDRYKTDC